MVPDWSIRFGMVELLEERPEGVLLHVKVVPGSSRDVIAGVLGSRLKVKVAAAAEKGKANQAVLALLAQALGVSKTRCAMVFGHTAAEKTIEIRGISVAQVREALRAHGVAGV